MVLVRGAVHELDGPSCAMLDMIVLMYVRTFGGRCPHRKYRSARA